ncbi:MAG: hypothetical protein PHU35_06000 [Bacteroidales bacterium]|nr:hypothetical protein [Syntrophomonas sp.]MDD4002327.1 hypothetical protein [Bacteroidales bacterium]
MDQSKIALLKMFDAHNTTQYVPLEEILKNFPNGIEDLKTLLDLGLISPYDDNEQFDPQADILEQLKPGPKLTQKGANLLLRYRFVF